MEIKNETLKPQMKIVAHNCGIFCFNFDAYDALERPKAVILGYSVEQRKFVLMGCSVDDKNAIRMAALHVMDGFFVVPTTLMSIKINTGEKEITVDGTSGYAEGTPALYFQLP